MLDFRIIAVRGCCTILSRKLPILANQAPALEIFFFSIQKSSLCHTLLCHKLVTTGITKFFL